MILFQKNFLNSILINFFFLLMGFGGLSILLFTLEDYTAKLYSGLLLILLAALFPIIYNFEAFKKYFSKAEFLVSFVFISIVFMMLVFNLPDHSRHNKLMSSTIFNSPINKTFVLFHKDMDVTKVKLYDAGIKIDGLNTINDIAAKNHTNPYNILEIIY